MRSNDRNDLCVASTIDSSTGFCHANVDIANRVQVVSVVQRTDNITEQGLG